MLLRFISYHILVWGFKYMSPEYHNSCIYNCALRVSQRFLIFYEVSDSCGKRANRQICIHTWMPVNNAAGKWDGHGCIRLWDWWYNYSVYWMSEMNIKLYYSMRVLRWLLKALKLVTVPGSVSNKPSSVMWIASRLSKNSAPSWRDDIDSDNRKYNLGATVHIIRA